MPKDVHFRCPIDANGKIFTEIQRITGERDVQGKPTGLFLSQ